MFLRKFFESNKRIFLIGLVTGAIYLPFVVLPSSFEGLFNFKENLITRYLFQLSIIFSGFGASLFYFFKNNLRVNFKNKFIFMLTIIPLIVCIFYIFLIYRVANSSFWMGFNYYFGLCLIYSWYLAQGFLVTDLLTNSKQIKLSWCLHLLGLFLGYFLSYFYLNFYGIYILIICVTALSTWIFFNLKNRYLLFLIPLLLYAKTIEKNINDYSGALNKSIKKESNKVDYVASINLNMYRQEIKNVYYNWGVRGLTEVEEDDSKMLTLYTNKKLNFSIFEKLYINNNRNFLYNYFFPTSENKVIIGAGGLRSLIGIKNEYLLKLNAIEINKGTIDFFKSYQPGPTYNLANQVNYLHLDGRFYIDTLEDHSVDLLVYEGSHHQTQSFSNEYLRPNHLTNSDAIKNAILKLTSNGVFIFEQNQMKKIYKTYQFLQIWKILNENHFFTTAFKDEKLDSYYVVGVRDRDQFFNFEKQLKKSNFKKVEVDYFKSKIELCNSNYNDDFPFLTIKCIKELAEVSIAPIILSSVLAFVVFIVFGYSIIRIQELQRPIAILVFIVGIIQQLMFSILQFKFDSYVYQDYFTNELIILISILSSIIGINTFSNSKKYKVDYVLSSILISAVLVLILPFLKLYLIKSVFNRICFVIFYSVFVFLPWGGIYPFLLKKVKEDSMGIFIFYDCLGLFIGYLFNYIFLRNFGGVYYSFLILFIILIFVFVYRRNMKLT